jgi:hypothetical protein
MNGLGHLARLPRLQPDDAAATPRLPSGWQSR